MRHLALALALTLAIALALAPAAALADPGLHHHPHGVEGLWAVLALLAGALAFWPVWRPVRRLAGRALARIIAR